MAGDRSRQVLLVEGLARQGQVGPAVEAAYAALRTDDASPHVHALIAELMLAGDFYDEAIRSATRAIELDPDCAPAYLALGLAYDRRGGMWDQSILVWHELAEVVPDLVTAHVQLGEAFSAAAFDEEAIESWRRALEIDPLEARAMYNLAVAALKREGVPTALPGFRKAGELDPSQDELFFALAGIGPLPDLLPNPDDIPDDRDALLKAAGLLARAEDYFGAADLVAGILDIDPNDAPARARASDMYLKQEAVNEGMAVALRSLMLDRDLASALYDLGVAYAKRPGLTRHAARVFAALAKAAPRHPMPHVLLAESLLGLQRYGQATQSYRRAVALDPACVRARFGLAAALLTEGRHAEAGWEIRRAAYYDTKRQGLFWRLYDDYVGGGV
ncbi:MAG: tetratricopeptide repeat protein [Coriobacteriia bacterium]|nr:tetratricopeptide repeat protein [Coriobacteriia bacterium]